MEWDVHFSLNGFYKITAPTPEEAVDIANEILEANVLNAEDMIHTGLGIEVYEVVESAEQYRDGDEE